MRQPCPVVAAVHPLHETETQGRDGAFEQVKAFADVLDLLTQLGDLVGRMTGLLAEQGDMAGLILGQVVQEADRIGLQIIQGLGVLVYADDETFRLHRDRRDVTADVQVALAMRSRREAVDRAVDSVPRFDADARHVCYD